MSSKLNLIGHHFGRLTVIGEAPSKRYGKSSQARWTCQCTCGNVIVVSRTCLKNGQQSCGCWQQERASTHKKSHTRAYQVWRGMIDRCTKPNHSNWARYGARGIFVDGAWLDFQTFWDDIGHLLEEKPGHQLDRIDNDGPYSPANCRIASRSENCRNQSTTLTVEHEGLQVRLRDLVDSIAHPSVTYRMASTRIFKEGMSVVDALAKPRGQHSRSRTGADRKNTKVRSSTDPRGRAKNVWHSMVARCFKPGHPNYKDYGGRGITICEEWCTFEGFWESIGKEVNEAIGLHLDRVDNNGPYSPANCRLSTPKENQQSKRNSRFYQYQGKNQTAAQLHPMAHPSVTLTTLTIRLRDFDWPVDRALATPFRPKTRKAKGLVEPIAEDQTEPEPEWGEGVYMHEGRRMTVDQLWRLAHQSINRSVLNHRLTMGWETDRAINEPDVRRYVSPVG